jgi:cytochrome b561
MSMSDRILVGVSQVAAGDDAAVAGGRYDGLAITLHWLTALLVVTLFALAEIWGFLPRGGARHTLQWVHISLGLSLTAVVLVRLVWRSTLARRLPPAGRGIAEFAARAVHYLFYALLITMFVTGFTKLWSQGHAASFFGLFAIPSPFAVSKTWHPLANAVHHWAAWTIIVLAGLHGTAALFHHYVLRDGVFRRMLPNSRDVKAH